LCVTAGNAASALIRRRRLPPRHAGLRKQAQHVRRPEFKHFGSHEVRVVRRACLLAGARVEPNAPMDVAQADRRSAGGASFSTVSGCINPSENCAEPTAARLQDALDSLLLTQVQRRLNDRATRALRKQGGSEMRRLERQAAGPL
jgi:hypothetical protein